MLIHSRKLARGQLTENPDINRVDQELIAKAFDDPVRNKSSVSVRTKDGVCTQCVNADRTTRDLLDCIHVHSNGCGRVFNDDDAKKRLHHVQNSTKLLLRKPRHTAAWSCL